MRIEQIVAKMATGKLLSGIANCHVVGVNSYVIQERVNSSQGMVRIFHATGGHSLATMFGSDCDFSLLPHNHRQDIELILLYGQVEHFVFCIKPASSYALPVYEMRFSPVLLGGDGEFRSLGASRISAPLASDMQVGSVVPVPYQTVHGMRVRSKSAAWAVREKAEAPKGWDPSCYSMLASKTAPKDGFYVPLSQPELSRFAMEVVDAVSI